MLKLAEAHLVLSGLFCAFLYTFIYIYRAFLGFSALLLKLEDKLLNSRTLDEGVIYVDLLAVRVDVIAGLCT